MKKFEITSWSYAAAAPNETAVNVDVKDEVAPGIEQKASYSFTLEQRFEVMSDEFMAAVGQKLSTAGLI
jgi:hypothetical protein